MTTEPKERPIIFSGEMVRAIIDGRKTQTRRIMKVQPPGEGFQMSRLIQSSDRADRKNEGKLHWIKRAENGLRIVESHNVYFNCPYGKVGDRLWVRETLAYGLCVPGPYAYKATHKPEDLDEGWFEPIKWTPALYMPRGASRITLEITNIRVGRLNDISESDAAAEGCDDSRGDAAISQGWFEKPRRAFRRLWEQINGAGSWDLNPWVWVIEFKVLEIKR